MSNKSFYLFFIYIVVLLSIFITVMFLNQGIIEKPMNQQEIKVVKATDKKMERLEIQTSPLFLFNTEKALQNRYISSISFTNEQDYMYYIQTIDNFYQLLNEEDYLGAYNHLLADFKDYKGLNNVDDFIKYVKERKLNNISANIINGDFIDTKNRMYLCDVSYFLRTFESEIDEFFIRNSQQKIADQLLVIKDVDGMYKISLEGLISTYNPNTRFIKDSVSLRIDKIYCFKNRFIIKVRLNEEFDKSFNTSITYVDEGNREEYIEKIYFNKGEREKSITFLITYSKDSSFKFE